MEYIVVNKTEKGIELWNGIDKDEWLNPAYMTLLGDYPGFEMNDLVEIVLRKKVHSEGQ
jgi:hypothetical protein